MPRSPDPARRTIGTLAVLAGAVTALLALLAIPWTPPAQNLHSGDVALAERVRQLLPDTGSVGVSVTLSEQGRTRQAALGTLDGSHPLAPDAPFETASVQKLLTAWLLADMVTTGQVALDDTLAELWPGTDFADADLANTTLEQLATHTSGLPSFPVGTDQGLYRALPDYLLGGDAYAHLGDPLAAAAVTDVGRGAGFAYSNLGYAVLGETLAHAAGQDYADLLAERVLRPLGMNHTEIRTSGVPDGAALPHRGPSIPVVPWTGLGYAPVGTGTWTTASDLNRLLQAAMDRGSPVSRLAQLPRAGVADYQAHSGRVGLGWMLWQQDGTEIAWHNGLTSGTRTFVAHTDDGRSVVVMANSTRAPVEHIGFELLGVDAPELAAADSVPLVPIVITTLLCSAAPALALSRMLRTGVRRFSRPLDRLAIVAHLLWGSALWLLGLRVGEWSAVPVALWVCGGGLLGAAVLVGLHQWRRVPWARGRRPWLRWVVFAVPTAAAAALLALEVVVLAQLP
ncbi:serine hydrolase domain-containing protein [Saccharopolyspora sp. 5N102]|uniref:serine hydrolase domain-containing protein n=1 Tax=Saccharopolyspora sp. 5N102 TaxID=3375155 RepID=UPI0037A8DD0F